MSPADFVLLLEFAQNGVTPPVGTDFVPQADNLPPLRQRYITLKHTVNSLLFKQWGDDTMALLDTEKAKKIQGIHFSAKHQADSKGKQEGRVIGDLSGQHDPAYTPLNGTSDVHGWDELVLWKKDLKGAFNLLNYNPDYCKLFAFLLSDGLTIIHFGALLLVC